MTRPPAGDTTDQRLFIRHLHAHREAAPVDGSFADDVRHGLSAERKHLPPKYFYDALGSQLFDAICLLPEYYLTRAENEILARDADEIVRAVGGQHMTLMELGSGSAVKTRSIIEALLKRQSKLVYIPVDISASALEMSARVLLQSYPSLEIDAYASDYHTALAYFRREKSDDRNSTGARLLALFLGSNIGNFNSGEAHEFLRVLRRSALREGDALLLGADLKKDASVLEAAYDDALGVTAAFNLNLLARINREFDADFNPRHFRHVAFYNEPEGRIEVYIESTRTQDVQLRRLDMTVSFAEGERIHTENSYKYDLAQLTRLAADTGFVRAQTWLDSAEAFSSNLFVAVGEDREGAR
ncbi:MAG TPA: L-histidine N(alpha)-methyltransferase [Pyrinomonadaceae bacterium]|jgi:dimethylhistidine N-methyltransferase